MEGNYTIAGTPEVRIAVRVRGLSLEQRYFDEETSTIRLTPDFIVIRIRELVDLDIELHVTNIRTQIGGIYRVAWINTRPVQDWYSIGLELLDPEGEIWESDSLPYSLKTAEAVPPALLECQRCCQRISVAVPEADPESLCEGFTMARHCDNCKATTSWVLSVEKPLAPDSPRAHQPEGTASTASATPPADGSAAKSTTCAEDHRQKGRAPIRMAIKIIRNRYGLETSDVNETINVSRTGVYFTTVQNYEVGEYVRVVLPYHPDGVAIPVSARVVRQDQGKESYRKRVAVQLNPGPGLTA